MSEDIVIHKGLENIYVKETRISYIDGVEGRVYYRGYDLEELVEKSFYEEVSYLLIFGKLPTKRELYNWIGDISRNYRLEEGIIRILKELPRNSSPLDILKYSLLTIGLWDEKMNSLEKEDLYEKIVKILGKTPSILASWYRIRRGLQPIEPDTSLGYAENFIYMIRGETSALDAEIFDDVLILHAEHGLNASAFAGMVTISTLSDLYSALTSSINTLKGPLHGGAAGAALKMFREIGSPDRVEEYFDMKLSRKERIMGFGHRVYKTYDPRARILKNILSRLELPPSVDKLYRIALKVEEVGMERLCKPKRICPNIDLFSGILYLYLGFPDDFSPAIFALSRLSGWIAHILEYLEEPRLIRPRAKYVGELGLRYIPLEERGG